jgi:RNA polymerase sigma-70 factor (ECF subfamily)
MSFPFLKPTIGSVETLVEKTKSGDTASFGKIYDFFVDQIYRYIFYRVGSVEIAQDLTSETFLNALEKLTQFKKNTNFRAWLYTIARNKIIDFYRTNKKFVQLEKVADFVFEDHITDIQSREEADFTWRSLKKLEKPEQEVIILHSIEGLSFEEIALITKRSPGSLRILKYRALIKLKNMLYDRNQ